MVERKGRESLMEEVEWRPLYGGAQGEGKFNGRSRMETIVWLERKGRESLNEEVERRPLSGGAQGGEVKVKK